MFGCYLWMKDAFDPATRSGTSADQRKRMLVTVAQEKHNSCNEKSRRRQKIDTRGTQGNPTRMRRGLLPAEKTAQEARI